MLVVTVEALDEDVVLGTQQASQGGRVLCYQRCAAWRDIIEERGVANALRFVSRRPPKEYEHTIITDVDLLWFEPDDYINDHWQYHIGGTCKGHRGPKRRPYRPEITGEQAWSGEWERVAGGMFYVRSDWYDETRQMRDMLAEQLYRGDLPFFRELDEVMLARLIKGSALKMPETRFFPPELRGVHLGDFKRSMHHRWTNPATMKQKLSDGSAISYMRMEQESKWREIRKWCCKQSREVREVMANVDTYMADRLKRMPGRVEGINA